MQLTRLSRRQAIFGLGLSLLTGGAASGCATKSVKRTSIDEPKGPLGELDPIDHQTTYVDSVDALFDVLIPTEASSPGAREAKAEDVIAIDRFAALATALGFLPDLSDAQIRSLTNLGDVFRAALNADLDAMSILEKPLTPFHKLPRVNQEAVVQRAFDDDNMKPAMTIVRAACFIAWLGATTNDVGLRAIGFPAFQDFDDALAVSGYPIEKNNDDYTFNEVPPNGGDDLSTVLDANGDLF